MSAARDGLRIRYIIDTHTHADHFWASREIGITLDVPIVMHRDSPAPFADLRSATGRTDLPTGDPDARYESLFNGIPADRRHVTG